MVKWWLVHPDDGVSINLLSRSGCQETRDAAQGLEKVSEARWEIC
jgi:hypothetical protein